MAANRNVLNSTDRQRQASAGPSVRAARSDIHPPAARKCSALQALSEADANPVERAASSERRERSQQLMKQRRLPRLHHGTA